MDTNINSNNNLVEENNKLRTELSLLSETCSQSQDIIEKLKESEEKFRLIFETSNYAIVISSLNDGKIEDFNDVLPSITGYTREELSNNSSIEMNLWIDQEKRKQVTSNLLKGEKVNNLEVDFRKKNGEILTGLYSARILHHNNDRFILSNIADITELKQMESEIKNEDKFLSNIIDNVPNIIFVKEARNLRFISVNSEAEKFFGHSKKDMIGKNDYDFFKKEEADIFTNKDREVLNSRKVFDIEEEKISTKDKGERILHTKKIALLNDNGEPAYLLGISEDITDRKLDENKIKEQNLLMTTIFEKAPIGFAVNNIFDGKVIFVSEKFEKIYGLEGHDLKSVDDFFEKVYLDPVYREQTRKRISDAIKTGNPSKMKWENVAITTHTGEQKIISATDIPIIEQNMMVSIVQDVTDNVKRGEELEKMNRFMVNRELKMIELKKEIADLKAKLEK